MPSSKKDMSMWEWLVEITTKLRKKLLWRLASSTRKTFKNNTVLWMLKISEPWLAKLSKLKLMVKEDRKPGSHWRKKTTLQLFTKMLRYSLVPTLTTNYSWPLDSKTLPERSLLPVMASTTLMLLSTLMLALLWDPDAPLPSMRAHWFLPMTTSNPQLEL